MVLAAYRRGFRLLFDLVILLIHIQHMY